MTELTSEQTKRLERLAQRPGSEIDLSDMPETTNWEGAGALEDAENKPSK